MSGLVPVSERRYTARRFVVLAVFGLAIYGGVRVVSTVTGDEGNAAADPNASVGAASTTVPSASGAAPGPTTMHGPTTVTPTTVAPAAVADTPTVDDPSKVLIVGDSDAGTFGPYLQILLGEQDAVGELVDVTLDYVVSSGLARPDFHDWPEHLSDALAETQPDIVIVTFGGNDAQGLSEPCADGPKTCQPDWVVGDPVSNEAEWTTEYVARVNVMLDLMLEGGRRVIWVGIPNAKSPEMTAGLRIQDQAVRTALEGREGVSFVDTWDMFDGRNGNYAELVPDPRDGEVKQIRAADGFHLNGTGAEILALKVFAEIEVVLRDLGAPL